MRFSRLTEKQRKGRESERLAAAYLARAGYEIRARNARFPVGELDIIARDGQTLCFVEVRARHSTTFGASADSVTARKRQHLIRAARWYLHRLREQPALVRFDVVAIDWKPDGSPAIQLIRGAFDASH